MNPKFSDHSPLKIQITREHCEGPKPFRYLNCIIDHEEFLVVVERGWLHHSREGYMEIFWKNLKLIKINTKAFRGVDNQLDNLRQQLDSIQTSMRHPGHDHDLFRQEKDIKLQLEKWDNIAESILK